jgi:GT2 family glycosyltransferase
MMYEGHMISVIIVNYNGKEFTQACLQSLRAVSPAAEHEIIVVDNCSTDGSCEMIRTEFPEAIVLKQDFNEGFGRANNKGALKARGEYLLFINNDTLFKQDILSPLKDFMETDHSIGAAAPMLLNPDETFQLSYGYHPSIINEFRTKRATASIKRMQTDRSPKQVDWVSFAAVLVRKSVFEKLKGFDARYFMYFEDADYCYRMQKLGFKTFYCPEYSIIHAGGGSWSSTVANKIKIEYRRSQITYYQSHRSLCETVTLRLFLVLRFLCSMAIHNGDDRRRDRTIIKLTTSYNANRS